MLIVLEIAPEMNGWAAAIIRTWACQSMDLVPCLPHGVAQSNTAKCSCFSPGAPSILPYPKITSFARSMSSAERPMYAKVSKNTF